MPVYAQTKSVDYRLLKQLYDEKRFFELRETIAGNKNEISPKLLFYRGALANVFFQPPVSVSYLNQYIANSQRDDEFLTEAYGLLADNFVKTFHYGKAADALQTVVEKLTNKLKPDEVADYKNGLNFYETLRKIPRQTLKVSKDFTIGKTGNTNGWSIPVEANNQRIDLGFDSGANVSILAESIAKKLGVEIFDSSVSLGSITSIKTLPKAGILPAMKIGGSTIHNTIFLVLDDKILTFADGSMLEGVIGFPVISAFREITFNQDGTISISKKLSGKKPVNMGLDGKDIFFRGNYRNENLTFMLDTGASRTILYLPFFRKFESEVKAKFELKTEEFTGVGGTEKTEAYLVKDFTVNFSDQPVHLPEVRLLTKALNDNGKYFYGNIGGDLIKQYKSITLDFDSMNISFK